MTDYGSNEFGISEFGSTLTYSTFKSSSLRVKVLGQQKSISSTLRIKVIGNQLFLPTQLRVLATQQTFLSTNLRVNATQEVFKSTTLRVNATQQKSLSSQLRVKVLGQQLSLPSSLVVRIIGQVIYEDFGRASFGDDSQFGSTSGYLSLPSSLLVRASITVSLPTNLRVKAVGQQVFLSSTLRINATQEVFVPSTLKVRVEDNQIFLPTNLRILLTSEIFLPTDLRVNATQTTSLPTVLKVRAIGLQTSLPTTLRVVLVYTTDFTPSCSFNSYNLNASSGAHVDIINQDFGIVEGARTIIGFRADPYEDTYTNDDLHEIIWNVDSQSGTANYYHSPTVNGLRTNHTKTFGLDPIAWNEVWSTVSGTVDISGDYATSGAQINISVPNTGTAWSPPTPSGSNVYDIPALHHGSLVLVNQPTDWDGDQTHKIHDWCPYQANIGHAVQVSDMDLISGTHVNNLIRVYGVINTDYLIDFKVYHASPKEWQWYSGATLDNNGTIAGHTVDVWDFINNLDVGQQAGAGTYNYTLKLYSASGTYLHPNDPVRIIDVEFIIP